MHKKTTQTNGQNFHRYLKQVEGLGEVGAAVISASLKPHTAKHVSSIWQHAGLNPERRRDGV